MSAQITLVRAVCTSFACPAQWDAWDADGQQYYLRFECGHGTFRRLAEPNQYWPPGELLAEFHWGGEWEDRIDLAEFVIQARLNVADGAVLTDFRAEILRAIAETYPKEWEARYGDGEAVLCHTPACAEARRSPDFEDDHVQSCHMLPPEGW